MKRLLFLFSIIISVTTSIHGQEIKGRVISNDGTPVADANVVLQNSRQSYPDNQRQANDNDPGTGGYVAQDNPDRAC